MNGPRVAVVTTAPVRVLRHWPAASLERAEAALRGPWRAWCERWGLEPGAMRAANAVDAEGEPASWETPLPGAWLGASTPAASGLDFALFGDAGGAQVAAHAAERALDDLVTTLRAQFASAAVREDALDGRDRPPARERSRWSGALRFEARATGLAGEFALSLHLAPSHAQRICGAPPPAMRSTGPRPVLTAIEDAIAARRVRLRIELDPLTLTLGTLQTLHVDDVVPLSHLLDQPLHVFDTAAPPDAAPFCAAWLGARDSLRAVELVSARSSLPGSSES